MYIRLMGYKIKCFTTDLSPDPSPQNVFVNYAWYGSSFFSCFVFLFCFQPTSLSLLLLKSYNRRHYPAGRVHGVHCSFPHSLENIINNRSPSLSLHLCCLPAPPALKPWLHSGLRLQPIDYGREREGKKKRGSKREREKARPRRQGALPS